MAVVAVAVLAALVWALQRPKPGIVGDNGIPPASFVTNLRPGQTVCNALGGVERPADALRATLGTYDKPAQPLAVSVDGGAAVVTSGYRSGVVALRLPVGARQGGRLACIRNVGTARVAVAGTLGSGATVNGKPKRFAVSLLLVDDDPPPWFSEASDTLAHIGDASGAPFGPATGWIGAGLFGVAIVASLAMAARVLSR